MFKELDKENIMKLNKEDTKHYIQSLAKKFKTDPFV